MRMGNRDTYPLQQEARLRLVEPDSRWTSGVVVAFRELELRAYAREEFLGLGGTIVTSRVDSQGLWYDTVPDGNSTCMKASRWD
jgi:hypothetical protein